MEELHGRAVRRVTLTIGLFCGAELLLNMLDRANVSYAALQMNQELGFDPKIYGFGVSLFFVGHLLAALPASGAVKKWGPRRPLIVMIIAWGLVAMAMGAIYDSASFFVLRFLLGVGEAGAASAVTLILATWVPQRTFGRAMMLTTLAQPVGYLIGGPASGWIMSVSHEFGGLSGWRWMFMAEGGLTVLFGLFTWFWLAEGPASAKWLSADEKAGLLKELAEDAQRGDVVAGGRSRATLLDILTNLRIWLFGLILFSIAMGMYGFAYWLPQVIQASHQTTGVFGVTIISAVPWMGTISGMLLFGWSSDRRRERWRHLGVAMLLGATGLVLSGLLRGDANWAVAGLTLGAFGLGAATTVFWTIPPAYLAGTSGAALAFAFINIIANMAGVVGPNLIGLMRAQTGDFTSSIYLLAAVLGGGLVFVLLAARNWAVKARPAETIA